MRETSELIGMSFRCCTKLLEMGNSPGIIENFPSQSQPRKLTENETKSAALKPYAKAVPIRFIQNLSMVEVTLARISGQTTARRVREETSLRRLVIGI